MTSQEETQTALVKAAAPKFGAPPRVDVSRFSSPFRLEGSKFKFRASRCEGPPESQLIKAGLIKTETVSSVLYKRTSSSYGYLPDSAIKPCASDRHMIGKHPLNGKFTDHMVKVGFGRTGNFMKVSKPSHVVWGRESNQPGTAAWDTYRG